MNWIKNILIWISIAIVVGIAISVANPSQFHPMMFIVLICIALLVGSFRIFFSRMVVYNRKGEIFKEATKYFKAKKNPNGNPEFEFGNRKIIIDYDFDIGFRTSSEYVITYIKTPEINSTNIEEFKRQFEIEKIRNEHYVRFFSSWNYEGNTFEDRLSKKIEELKVFIESNAC
jgi:hypothetical protein